MDGNTGGIGVSGPHVKGINAQRKLAIRRAVEEIARQRGVEVRNILQLVQEGNRDRVHTYHKNYSIHTTEGRTITAEIKDIWKDQETNELYVWMVVK